MATAKITGGIDLKKFIKNLIEQTGHASLEVGFTDPEYATIAYKNEYGGEYKVDQDYKDRALKKGVHLGDTIRIPPRPFMQQTVDTKGKTWGNVLAKSIHDAQYNIPTALGLLGTKMEADVKSTIRDGDYIDNSARTQKIKGFNKPLIDSGSMLQNVTYEVHQ
jgi:hypothetical protein